MNNLEMPDERAVSVQAHGAVTTDEVEYARAKVETALPFAHGPILSVRVRLTRHGDPAVDRPAVAQVNVNLNGRLVRVQASRPTLSEAVDEIRDRLRDRLQRAANDWESIRGGLTQPKDWRHTSALTDRSQRPSSPAAEPQIVRHKTRAPGRTTVDEAAFDMEMLDYEFHLFTEDGSGIDSVLYRAADGSGYRLSQLDPRPDEVTPGAVPLSVSPSRAPVLRVEQAVERLNVTGWPFVFFRDAATGRGHAVYHRHDRDFGLITPES